MDSKPLFGPPRKPGRPPGVRNRPKPAEVPHVVVKEDYGHADPDTIVSRQLLMLDWAQQVMREEMRKAMNTKPVNVAGVDVFKLEELSIAIVRAIEALKKSSDLADEMASRMSPEQLLEAALKKLEAQDLATVKYAIKRLTAHKERITTAEVALPPSSAADAINALDA